LAVYGRLVCPFISGKVNVTQLAINLLGVFAVQVVLREGLFSAFGAANGKRSLARQGYRLSMLVWFLTGLVAMAVHAIRYDFPFGSHVKLLSGYWLVGGGILAQWEYIVLEHASRRHSFRMQNPAQFLERITRRVLEGNFVLTLGPSLAMMLVVWRYAREGQLESQVFVEVAYLGLFCVLIGLLMAYRYGQSLRADTREMVSGIQSIGDGTLSVRLDCSRLDELGEVASGVNDMVRSLEKSNQQLKRRLEERAALGEVAMASSSGDDVDHVLDLITAKSRDVAKAEACSLLLLRKETNKLHFHSTRGDGSEVLDEATIEFGQGIIGTVAQSQKSMIVKDAYADQQFDPSFDLATGFTTRSMMTVALVAKDGTTLGVVQALNKVGRDSFQDDDLKLLEAFAAQASIAIENARLYGETRQLAVDLRDALEQERNLSIEKEKMSAYIPKTVVDAISRNREEKLALGGKTVCATMLFCDIKGFTSLSENLDPQELVNLLNIYMTSMTNIIIEESGIIDKFMGDGIMAIFTSEEHGEAALNSVRAGVRMQKQMRVFHDQWKETNPLLAALTIRVGINTGNVVAGNIGAETRMDYTVIGDEVNVASRVEGACTPGFVWITESTQVLAGSSVESTRMKPISVKNRAEPVQCFEVSCDGVAC
jgi:adenylate cyclase